jgi:hypothetical protein
VFHRRPLRMLFHLTPQGRLGAPVCGQAPTPRSPFCIVPAHG